MALDDIIKTMFKEYGTLENISKIFSSPTRYEEFVSNSDLFKKIEEVIVKNRWIPGVETILNINRATISAGLNTKKDDLENQELVGLDKKSTYKRILEDIDPNQIEDPNFLEMYWYQVAANIGVIDKDSKLSEPAKRIYLASQINKALKEADTEDGITLLKDTLRGNYNPEYERLKNALASQGVDKNTFTKELARNVAETQLKAAEIRYQEQEEKEGKQVFKYNRKDDIKNIQSAIESYIEKTEDKGVLAKTYNTMANTKREIQTLQEQIEAAKKKAEESTKKK